MAGLDGDLEVDEALLTALKSWRREQARQQGVPPYVVFHDRTLVELAAQQPATLEALGRIGGIGTAKLTRYGEALLGRLPQLKADFERRLSTDPDFAADTGARTSYWLDALPPQDPGLNVHPVMRVDAAMK
jgi:ribonuclease D